jgi:hypothetical protein
MENKLQPYLTDQDIKRISKRINRGKVYDVTVAIMDSDELEELLSSGWEPFSSYYAPEGYSDRGYALPNICWIVLRYVE